MYSQPSLQGRDRALAGMTAQIAQMRCGSAAPGPHINESQQLTLTYCSPPLVLNGAQVQASLLMSCFLASMISWDPGVHATLPAAHMVLKQPF